MSDIEEREPDNFSSAGRDWQSSVPAFLSFVRKPGLATFDSISKLPFDVRVITGLSASERELTRVSEAATTAVSGVEGVKVAIGGSTADSRSIEIRYRGDGVDPTKVRESALAEAAAVSTDGTLPVPIRTIDSPELGESTATYTGGSPLWRVKSKASECTSGFGVTRGGVNGTTTAAHCYDYLLYGIQKQDGVISFVTEASGGPNGVRIDIQFHRSINDYSASADFAATSAAASGRRTVGAHVNATVGDVSCKWGNGNYFAGSSASGYDCAYVSQLNQTVTYVGQGTFVGLAQWDRDILIPGDSGGPSFFGTTAQGSNSGHNVSADISWFVPQSRWASNLGATIRTG